MQHGIVFYVEIYSNLRHYCLLFQNASSADTLSSRGKTEDYETKVVSNPVMYSTIQWREGNASGGQYWSIL